MERLARAGAALLTIAVAFTLRAAPLRTAAARTHVITVENMAFSPKSLTVRRDDLVVWVNKDFFPHTATANSKVFDSHEIAAQASWTYLANKPGEYAYSCAYHPSMKGKIIVR